MSANVATVIDQLKSDGIKLFSYIDPAAKAQPDFEHGSLDAELETMSRERPARSIRSSVGLKDSFGYIYTSGTTGLPKACVIKNLKYLTVAKGEI